MIQGSEEMTDNDTIEKSCYNNEPDSCIKFGGLYQWDEMMQYNSQQGVQGICPPGWHLPTDEEWKVLEGAVDSQYGIGDPMWDGNLYRGSDVGLNLKSTYDWVNEGNGTDLFGFSGLPGGFYSFYGYFTGVGYYGCWWTAAELNNDNKWFRFLYFNYSEVYRRYYYKGYGFSVRCLKNN